VDRAAPPRKRVIIDAFAGAGGNAIAFALSGRWDTVFAVEKDPKTMLCAKHNAEIYGVANRIWWIEGDIFEVMKTRFRSMKMAVMFASPPWGGKRDPPDRRSTG
jgi:trimethylguanosine synthase